MNSVNLLKTDSAIIPSGAFENKTLLLDNGSPERLKTNDPQLANVDCSIF